MCLFLIFFVMVDAVGLFNEKGINYELPKEFNDDVIRAKDNIKREKKGSSRSLVYMSALMATLLMMASPTFCQSEKDPNKNPTFSIEMVKNYPSLKYLVDNFDKTFNDPEMKKHLEEMIAKIISQHNQEGVESALKQTLMLLKDPKQKIAGSIGSIEEFVVYDKKFEDKYGDAISDETMLVMEEFNKIYDKRMDAELERLNKLLASEKAALAKERQEVEEILKSFSTQQVKTNQKLRKGLVKFKSTLTKEEIAKLSSHTQELLNLVP